MSAVSAVQRAVRTGLRGAVRVPGLRPLLAGLGHAGLLPAGLWRRLPAEGETTVRLPGGASFRYASTPRDLVGRALTWRGWRGYEPETLAVFLRLAARAEGVVDVGAFTGLFTLLALAVHPRSQAIAFEPVPRIRELLVANLRLNGWADRCEVRGEAVADVSGSAQMHVPGLDLPTGSSLCPEVVSGRATVPITVPVTTLDEACAEMARVDLVKLDAELVEDRVLAGMQRILAGQRPAIVLECHACGPHERVGELLRAAGYGWAHLLPGGPRPVERIVPDRRGRWLNFLATPAERDLSELLAPDGGGEST